MEIDHCRLQGTVTQILLDQAQVDAGLEQVRGVTVPERVDRDPLAEPEFLHHALHRAVNAGTCHRFDRRAGFCMVPPRGREQPDRVAMRHPVLAEHSQGLRRERHVAIFGALAAMNMDDHPRAVDVADLEIQTFLETQPQRVDGPEVGFVVRSTHGVDETTNFRDAQDIRQGLGSGKADVPESLPVARDGVGVEEDDAAGSDLQRTGKVLSLVLEVEPVLSRTS